MVSHQLFDEDLPVSNTATNMAGPTDILDFTSAFVFPVHTPIHTGAVSLVSHAASGSATGLFNLGVTQMDAAVTPFLFAFPAIAPMTTGVNVSLMPSSDDDMSA